MTWRWFGYFYLDPGFKLCEEFSDGPKIFVQVLLTVGDKTNGVDAKCVADVVDASEMKLLRHSDDIPQAKDVAGAVAAFVGAEASVV